MKTVTDFIIRCDRYNYEVVEVTEDFPTRGKVSGSEYFGWNIVCHSRNKTLIVYPNYHSNYQGEFTYGPLYEDTGGGCSRNPDHAWEYLTTDRPSMRPDSDPIKED